VFAPGLGSLLLLILSFTRAREYQKTLNHARTQL